MSCEVWDKSERVLLPNICGDQLFFAPLFYYEKDKAISIYYNFTDSKQDPETLADYFAKNISKLDILKKQFDQDSVQVREITESKDPRDLEKLFNSILKVWPLIALASAFADLENVDPVVLEKSVQIRKESDGLLHWADEELYNKAESMVPDKYKEDAGFLMLNEVLSENYPSGEEISRRKDSYVFYNGKLSSGISLESFAKENDIEFVEDLVSEDSNLKEIKGSIAHKGVVRGNVRLVFERKDIKKVNDGDILVTPMTTPNLIDAMNKAIAFVTDEGGITCHAAIVAREMAKPCIIGTKIATKVLKDGMKVEVDANEGVIKIL